MRTIKNLNANKRSLIYIAVASNGGKGVSISNIKLMEDVYKKLEKELPPRCLCGGVLKPSTVLFGEPLPQYALDMATLASKNCDMFLVLGSSLVVYPAASMPRLAKKGGAGLVIINIDPTPLDHIADIVIHDSTSKVLSTVIKRGWNV